MSSLPPGEGEAGPGVAQGHLRVLGAVADTWMGGGVPPVVEVEIVEQAATGGGPGVQSQPVAHPPTGVAHQHAVVVAAHPGPVLGQQAHGLHGGVLHQIGDVVEILVLVFEIPHGRDSFAWYLPLSIP